MQKSLHLLRWPLRPKVNRRIFSRLWRCSPLAIAHEFDGRSVSPRPWIDAIVWPANLLQTRSREEKWRSPLVTSAATLVKPEPVRFDRRSPAVTPERGLE